MFTIIILTGRSGKFIFSLVTHHFKFYLGKESKWASEIFLLFPYKIGFVETNEL